MRKLAFHEQKLLKKVDFLTWKTEENLREIKVIRRYHIQKREDYVKYNRLVGRITALVTKLKALPTDSGVRVKATEQVLSKLYGLGLIPTKTSLAQASAISASAFCRRRLPVVMVRLRMSETVKAAVGLVESGHVRVGVDVVTDPATIVTRAMEDFVTWVDSSKIRRTIAKYNDKLDDFDLLGE